MKSKRKVISTGASCDEVSLCLFLAILNISAFSSPYEIIRLCYAEVQPDINLKFWMYEATYAVSALKKSHVFDDVVSGTKSSRLLKSV